MNKTPCESCGKPIIFKETKSGQKMPFDAKEVPIYVQPLDEDSQHSGIIEGRIPHFITCPDAEKWSGSSRADKQT